MSIPTPLIRIYEYVSVIMNSMNISYTCKVWRSDSRTTTGSPGLAGQPVFERVLVSRRDVFVSQISVFETRRSGPKYRLASKTKDKVLHDFTACCD